MANAGEEQGKETEKRIEDEDRDISESDMDIKVEPSELLETCSTCGKDFKIRIDLNRSLEIHI